MNGMIMSYTHSPLYDIGWLGILEMIISEDKSLRVQLVPLYMRTHSAFTCEDSDKTTMNRNTP